MARALALPQQADLSTGFGLRPSRVHCALQGRAGKGRRDEGRGDEGGVVSRKKVSGRPEKEEGSKQRKGSSRTGEEEKSRRFITVDLIAIFSLGPNVILRCGQKITTSLSGPHSGRPALWETWSWSPRGLDWAEG